MTSERYSAKILPLIRHEISMKPIAILIKNNAPCQKTAKTMKGLDGLNINYMSFPAFSLLLNPIESLWNTMKDQIAMRYREEGRNPRCQGRRMPISL